MSTARAEAVVAGHICLDLIPEMYHAQPLAPGKLLRVGPALCSTGGAVANTGLAMHRLGIPAMLMGKVGDDPFGRQIQDIVLAYGELPARGMIVTHGETTSYTVVISPPGVDRTFLHCPGANDTFAASDVMFDQLEGVRLFHFGYPPLMKRMYEDGGDNLRDMFARVRAVGPTTSLDMVAIDPKSEAAAVDWAALLGRVLPEVDIFLPSIEEILFMLERPTADRLEAKGGVDIGADVDPDMLRRMGDRILEMGAAIAVLKLGNQGLYLRTTPDRERLANMGACAPVDLEDWVDRELHAPCLTVKVVGTNGAGDSTIAGFLTALMRGQGATQAMTSAIGVGSCSVEKADANSGIPSWQAVMDRIAAGWPEDPVTIPFAGWETAGPNGVRRSPRDAGR
jgi:sugar/nucleoside kinase (ribokinase family)